jgi:hypothetical protein
VQWRNAAYAVQWWVFALFTLWMWARMVRDETRRARAEAADGTAAVPGPAADPDAKEPVPAGDNGARDDA